MIQNGTRAQASGEQALACVSGDISLVRALGIRGIPVAVAAGSRDAKALRSRYCVDDFDVPDWHTDPDGAVDAVLAWARQQERRPVLFYQGDADLIAISRARERIAKHAHCLLPPPDLVERLADKARFSELAAETGLSVPETIEFTAACDEDAVIDRWQLFPAVLKPVMRLPGWHRLVGGNQKVLRVDDTGALRDILRRVAGEAGGSRFLLQALIEGGERNILSYHAYVRPGGEVVCEFTGRKVRTAPRRFGLSTCVEITDDPVVRNSGRDVIERLGFHGVLKIDYKRDHRSGDLQILEINPRFNLWHHAGTVAGAPIPELVYRDCLEPGSAAVTAAPPAGTRWIVPLSDFRAFRETRMKHGTSWFTWLKEVVTAEVNEGFTLSDPRPALHDIRKLLRGGSNKRRGAA